MSIEYFIGQIVHPPDAQSPPWYWILFSNSNPYPSLVLLKQKTLNDYEKNLTYFSNDPVRSSIRSADRVCVTY